MPKEAVEITQFRGMIGGGEERDLPEGYAIYAKNLDAINQVGAFEPLPDDLNQDTTDSVFRALTRFSSGGGADYVAYCRHTTTNVEDTTGDYTPSASIGYAEPTLASLHAHANTEQVVELARTDGRLWVDASSNGEHVHMGFGPVLSPSSKWIGTIWHDQVTSMTAVDSATPEVEIHDAELRSDFIGFSNRDAVTIHVGSSKDVVNTAVPSLITVSFDGEPIFDHYTQYKYYASAIYDGDQEAPAQLVMSFNFGSASFSIADALGVGNEPTRDICFGSIQRDQRYYTSETATPTVNNNLTVAYTTAQWQKWARPGTETLVPIPGVSKLTWGLRVRIATSDSRPIINRRVTGIKLYRAAGGWDGKTKRFVFGSPLLIKKLSVQDANDFDLLTAGYDAQGSTDGVRPFEGPTGNQYMVAWIEDDLEGTSTFEDETGFSSTLEHMQLNYGLSVAAGGYHFIGRCYHPELESIQSWIFRSKPYRFDTFDWSADYLVLPTAPTAIVSFANRLYCFGNGRTYVVNPNSLDVEDEWEGIGAQEKQSVAVTDKGMFWGDFSNIYHHDGNRLTTIGHPVLHNRFNAKAGWLARDATPPLAVYDLRYDSVVFIYQNAGYCYGLMYHVASGKWQHITFDAADGTPTTNDPTRAYGSTYTEEGMPIVSFDTGLSNATKKIREVMGHTSTKRNWEFVGHQLPFVGSKVTYYHAYIGTDAVANVPTVTFYENDANYSSAATAWSGAETVEGDVRKGKINAGTWNRVRSFALRLSGTGSQSATHVSLIRRVVTPR